MDCINKIIKHNKQKMLFMKTYLDLNEKTIMLAEKSDLISLKKMFIKKKSLIKSINILDDEIVCLVSEFKEKGLSELVEKEKINEMKKISALVLKKMLDVKKSDEIYFLKINKVFGSCKNENLIEKN